jgi:exodeoxyribonuclease VII small subunit
MEKTNRARTGASKPGKTDFESALKKLEEIALKLEEGGLSLDESIRQFETGIRLAKFCREKLDEAERKIEILQKGGAGARATKRVEIDEDSGEIVDDDLQGSLL